MICKYYDCGFCYAPADAKNNSIQGGCFEPEYCATYLMQNKPMMTEKEHLECEIKELELEIKKHNEAIQNLNNIKERRTQKLKEMGNQPLDVIVIGGAKYRRVVEEPTPKPLTLSLYDFLLKNHNTMFSKSAICDMVRGWLIDHTVIETEDDEMITFTIHKEQLQRPK